MSALVKSLSELWVDELPLDSRFGQGAWDVKAVISEDCMSYVAWNDSSREAVWVDPKLEELETYKDLTRSLKGYLFLAVIDTHTHADHVSVAPQLASLLDAPLVMHVLSPSTQPTLRVSSRTCLASHAAKVEFIPTPGHTPDGMTVVWGPFVFTGDTVFYADVGRDDLPGGSPAAHFDSLKTLCGVLSPQHVVLPGHDFKAGQVSSWATQLRVNPSLTQGREEYIAEALAYDAPAPKAFKKSLFENLK